MESSKKMKASISEANSVVHNLANLLAQAQLAQSEIHANLLQESAELVTIDEFCKRTGYTKSAVNSKISAGKWCEGKVLVKSPDNNRLIDLKEFYKWARGLA